MPRSRAGVISIKGAKIYDDVSVAVFEKAKTEQDKPKPPPPLPPQDDPQARRQDEGRAEARRTAKPLDAPPPPAAGAGAGSDIPDFGLSLGGRHRRRRASRFRAGGPKVDAAPASSVQVSKKVLAAPAPTAAEACADPPTKPKVLSITQPAYTPEAREANVAAARCASSSLSMRRATSRRLASSRGSVMGSTKRRSPARAPRRSNQARGAGRLRLRRS